MKSQAIASLISLGSLLCLTANGQQANTSATTSAEAKPAASFKTFLKTNSVGQVIQQKVVAKDGDSEQWYNYFHNEKGEIVCQIARSASGELTSVILTTFRADGQVDVQTHFKPDGSLFKRFVHCYDDKGDWTHADIVDESGKKRGTMTSRPSSLTRKPQSE